MKNKLYHKSQITMSDTKDKNNFKGVLEDARNRHQNKTDTEIILGLIDTFINQKHYKFIIQCLLWIDDHNDDFTECDPIKEKIQIAELFLRKNSNSDYWFLEFCKTKDKSPEIKRNALMKLIESEFDFTTNDPFYTTSLDKELYNNDLLFQFILGKYNEITKLKKEYAKAIEQHKTDGTLPDTGPVTDLIAKYEEEIH